MKPKWIWEDEFVRPWIQKAKAADIKLTPKNRAKLKDAWLSWIGRHFGINGLFKANYGPIIKELIPDGSKLLNLIKKDNFKGRVITRESWGIKDPDLFYSGKTPYKKPSQDELNQIAFDKFIRK